MPSLAARVASEGQQWSLNQAQLRTMTVMRALAVEVRLGSARMSSRPGSLGSAVVRLAVREVAAGVVDRVVAQVMAGPPPR